jgi:hypothetical protein
VGFDYTTPSGRKRVSHDREDSMMRCAHCGRVMSNFAGGYSRIGGKPLCHPNVTGRPNCYELVDRYKHTMPCDGSLCYEDHPRGILDYIVVDEKVPF